MPYLNVNGGTVHRWSPVWAQGKTQVKQSHQSPHQALHWKISSVLHLQSFNHDTYGHNRTICSSPTILSSKKNRWIPDWLLRPGPTESWTFDIRKFDREGCKTPVFHASHAPKFSLASPTKPLGAPSCPKQAWFGWGCCPISARFMGQLCVWCRLSMMINVRTLKCTWFHWASSPVTLHHALKCFMCPHTAG